MIGLILQLVLVGLVLWLVETYIPMDAAIKTVIRIVVLVLVVLWLINIFGIMDVPVPRVR